MIVVLFLVLNWDEFHPSKNKFESLGAEELFRDSNGFQELICKLNISNHPSGAWCKISLEEFEKGTSYPNTYKKILLKLSSDEVVLGEEDIIKFFGEDVATFLH